MRRTLPLCLALFLAPLGAFGQKVTTEFDESLDFSKYKTFAWREGRIQSQHPALDNSLVEKRIRNLVVAQLKAKGLNETSDHPDLVATYALGARDRKEVERAPAGLRGRRIRREVHRYTQGTLILDLRDPAQKDLVWRAVCTDTARDPAKFEQHIDSDVKKAFEKFPPKKK